MRRVYVNEYIKINQSVESFRYSDEMLIFHFSSKEKKTDEKYEANFTETVDSRFDNASRSQAYTVGKKTGQHSSLFVITTKFHRRPPL